MVCSFAWRHYLLAISEAVAELRRPIMICSASVAIRSTSSAAGGHHRSAAGCEIDNRRNNVDGSAAGAMPACFRPLRDQNVGARIERLPRHVLALNLTDQQRPCLLDAGSERRGIAERKHHCAGSSTQRDIQQFGPPGETPGDEADAERRRASCEPADLPLQPCLVA